MLTDKELENRFGAMEGGLGEMDRVGFDGEVEEVEVVGSGRDEEEWAVSSAVVAFGSFKVVGGSNVVD